MEQAKIDRINALARKAKTPEGLTEEEKHERALLRREYLDAVKANLWRASWSTPTLQRPDGTRVPMKKAERLRFLIFRSMSKSSRELFNTLPSV